MNALDIILGTLILAIIALQTFRGFGRALFDALALYCTLLLATFVASSSAAMHISSSVAGTESFMFVVTFIVVGVLAIFLSRWVYGTVLLNLGMFEHLFGLVAGIACGLILAHAIVQGIAIGTQGSSDTDIIAASSIGQECLTFNSYHALVDTLYAETEGHPMSTTPG
jgi:uncharacterized membrane protein required for colicin V production